MMTTCLILESGAGCGDGTGAPLVPLLQLASSAPAQIRETQTTLRMSRYFPTGVKLSGPMPLTSMIVSPLAIA